MADADADTITPQEALALSGDVPKGSDTLGPTEPATAAAGGLLDDDKQPFDPALHQVDAFGNPKRTAAGRWARKTGNGARKAAGKPLAGNLTKGALPLPKAEESPAEAPAGQPDPSGFIAPPKAGESAQAAGQPAAGGDKVHDAELAPVELTPDECKATARAVINGSIGIARMTRGEHWTPDEAERSELIDSLSRIWAAYHLPRLGPVVEFAMVLISFIFNGEKRREDLKALWNWALGRKKTLEQKGSDQ